MNNIKQALLSEDEYIKKYCPLFIIAMNHGKLL